MHAYIGLYGCARFLVNQGDNSLLILNFGNTLISTPDAHRIDSVKILVFLIPFRRLWGKGMMLTLMENKRKI